MKRTYSFETADNALLSTDKMDPSTALLLPFLSNDCMPQSGLASGEHFQVGNKRTMRPCYSCDHLALNMGTRRLF
jgi:hypothetical protein